MAVKKTKAAKMVVARKKAAKKRVIAPALNGFTVAAPLKDELARVRKMLVLNDAKRQTELTAWSAPSRSKAARYSERQVARLAGRR
jgi:hypothetical protein